MSPAEAESISFAFVAVHLHDAAKAFFSTGPLVVVYFTLGHRALVDARVGKLTIFVIGDFEGHANGRQVGVALEFDLYLRIGWICGNNFVIEWARQITIYRIHQRLHGLVLESRAHEYGCKTLAGSWRFWTNS